ncbi:MULTISPECIES: 2Fe-2S iron-sulfur cluster-binding protein [Azospirillaceae]|uniref:2Fe-2S ferredoxin n=1 Tax=Nitrospirillum viridazoti CBAmc TaxID=1441467 RepID=A0A248JUR0_9PROT|nr:MULTISPECIES: 2Fe-2S iron-sulfur cluster-binding protein [Azospirillaceae]ASG22256.1 2Fe-2S ferredoxin [Nitrospirillum amazonense CBAmc]TWB30978.1 2Fe-2S ferredoxin [Nitrospirillum amazonense]
MPKITFIDPDGHRHDLEAEEGQSVMKVAVAHGVPGIEADCGGACACATCHVYVDPDWAAAAGSPQGDEAAMLEFAVEPQPTSRLSCQIKMGPALDGLLVRIPLSQH